MKKLMVCLTVGYCLVNTSAYAFYLVLEDFESGLGAWTIGSDMNMTTTTDPLDGLNTVGSVTRGIAYTNKNVASRSIGGVSSGKMTVFYQAYVPTNDMNHLITVTDVNPQGTYEFSDLDSIGRFGDSGPNANFYVYDEGSGYVTATTSTQTAAWYNIWNVIDLDTQQTDFYIQSDDDVDFATQTLVYNDAGFRGSHSGSLDTFAIRIADSLNPLYLDNLSVDISGLNLSNPVAVPESSSLLLLAVAFMLFGVIGRRH